MKILVLTMCIGIASCHPNLTRLKRQTSSASPEESSSTPSPSSSSTTSSPAIISTTSSPSQDGSNRFGIGAAAGIGGIGSSAGIGNFQADTRKNPFLPFGAFAGLNLGQGGRIGAGCSGLSCGFQLGDFVFATPQLLGVGENFGATTGSGDNSNRRYTRSGSGYYPYNFNDYYYPGYFPNYQMPFQPQPQSFPSFTNFAQQFQQFQRNQQQNFPQPNLGDFARMGNAGASAASFGFGGTNVNGRQSFTSTAVQSDPDGKVTTIYKSSGQPDVIDTRMAQPGRSNGVYASSGINVDSNGNVTSYRAGGNLS